MTEEIGSRQILNVSHTEIKIEVIDTGIFDIDYLNDNGKNTADSSMHVKDRKNDQCEDFHHDESLKLEECNLYSEDNTMSKNIISHSMKCNYQTPNETNIRDSMCIQFREKLSTPDCYFEIPKYPNLLLDERIDTGDTNFQYTEVAFKRSQTHNVASEGIHTEQKFLECTKCDFKTVQKQNLVIHKRTHSEEKPFKCTECSYKTAVKGYLLKHKRTHSGEKPFECTECAFRTAVKERLVRHIRIHSEEKPFECTECGFKTARKERLVRHIRTHTGEKPFECTECGFKTALKTSLVRHKLIHSEEKPFECTECGFKTAVKERLVRHIRTHSGEKPFECTECAFKTALKRSLVRHKLTHSEKKPFECTECGFRTARRESLLNHKRTHSREKLFKCIECDFKTGQRANWLVHKRTHPEEKPFDFTENKNVETSRKNDVVLQKQIEDMDDSRDILEVERCTAEVKLEFPEIKFEPESQLLIDNQLVNIRDIKTEPI